jgi:hypothetical protein
MPIPVDAIDQFTIEEGEEVRHLIGMRCWCHGPDGQPDPNCTQHEAGGWVFTSEQTITGLVTDISQNQELMETGVFIPGDCVFSPYSENIVSEGDKIIFTWPLPFGQGDPLVRGTGTTDRLYYEGVSGLACIDETKISYLSGIDYRIFGKNIEWYWTGKPAIGKAPLAGKRYTVKYQAYIEWLAFVPPVARISKGADMGNKVMLRKKHLLEHP